MEEERERFFSRLATIPGIRPMPSIGTWILLEVEKPSELARKVNRRIEPGTVSVPRHVQGAIRIPVRDPKTNEILFRCLRDLQKPVRSQQPSVDVVAQDNEPFAEAQ